MTQNSAQTVLEAVATAVPGTVKTSDGVLEATTQLAGETKDGVTTPEHLMAAAIASCLQQAIGIAASTQDVDASSARVEGTVTLKSDEEAGYTAAFALQVSGLPADAAERVLQQAQQLCPFTKALTPAGISVTLG
jgi:organic hydroperoxide reductase OsmC/OhrA